METGTGHHQVADPRVRRQQHRLEGRTPRHLCPPRLAPEGGDGGTRVFTEESWAGPLARLLPTAMRKTVRKALDDGLPALKAEAERRALSQS